MLKKSSGTSPGSDRDTPLSLPLQALQQHARKFLTQAKQPLDPSLDPCYQLMLWGLDKGLKNSDPEYMGQLRSAVETLAFQENSTHALTYLVQLPGSPEDKLVTPQQLATARDPMQASLRLLQALDWALTEDPKMAGLYPPVYPAEPQG